MALAVLHFQQPTATLQSPWAGGGRFPERMASPSIVSNHNTTPPTLWHLLLTSAAVASYSEEREEKESSAILRPEDLKI